MECFDSTNRSSRQLATNNVQKLRVVIKVQTPEEGKVDGTRPLYIVALGNRVECLGKSVTQLRSKQIADLGQCH